MSEYANQTVAQLKEILKAKGLSTDGKKADLVLRLQESDASAPAPAAEPAAEPEAAPVEPKEPVSKPEASTEEPKEEPKEEKEEVKEEPKVLSAEERKRLAVELLQKKIQRATKFGDDAAAETAKKDLARVEKFGVEVGTALAKEIGLVDTSLGNGTKKNRSRGRVDKNRKRRRH